MEKEGVTGQPMESDSAAASGVEVADRGESAYISRSPLSTHPTPLTGPRVTKARTQGTGPCPPFSSVRLFAN